MLSLLIPLAAEAAECTNTWTGPAEGTWQTAANWSAGHVPTESEVACIGAGKTVKVTSGTQKAAVVQGEGTLKIREATLEILSTMQTSSIKSLVDEYNSILTGPGDLHVTEFFEWRQASTMSGTGSTVLDAGATGAVTTGGGWATITGRRLLVEGSLAVNEGIVALQEGGVLENDGTLTINHETGTWDLLDNGGTVRPKLVNNGLLRKTAGTGETHFDINFENTGVIEAQTGTLGFTLAGSTGYIGDGSVLKGAIHLKGPNISAGSFDGKGATFNIREASISVGEEDVATIGGGTLDYKSVLSGPGIFELTGSLAWSSESTMSGSGSTVVAPGAALTVTTYNGLLAKRHLVNNGALNLEGEGSIRESEGAVVENTATLNANCVVSYARFPGIFDNGGAAQLVNYGTIQKTAGGSTVRFNVNLENYGTLKSGTGLFYFNKVGELEEFASGSVVEGQFTFEGPTVHIDDFDGSAAEVTLREGLLQLEGTENVFATLIAKYEGNLSGSGDIEVTKAFDWNGQGSISGAGKMVLASGTVNEIYAGNVVHSLAQRRLVNRGTIAQKNSDLVHMSNGAVFENAGIYSADSYPYCRCSSVIIEDTGEGSMPKFVNRGVFRRSTEANGTSTATIKVPFENLGAIKVEKGGLEFPEPLAVAAGSDTGHHCKCGDPIDMSTGDFGESQADFSIGGLGVGLDLVRSYSALAAAAATSPGAFGYGWTTSFGDHLTAEEEGNRITLTQADGSTVPFTKVGATYEAPAWSQDLLTGSPESGYTLTLPSQTVYGFSGAGQLESVTDRNGNETTLGYEAGRLTAITDPTGRQITLAYNPEGLVESAEDPMGHLVHYTYESKNLKSVIMPGEESPRWEFKYDGSHRMTSMTDGRGGKTSNEYDSSSRVISQTDPAGRTITLKYQSFHTTVTNKATGAVTDEWFNSNNQPYSITRGYGTAAASTETFTYDEGGRLVGRTDGNGHTTTFGYDEEGNRTSVKDAAGNETKWTYNAAHQVASETTPRGETTTIERDAAGNPVTISRPGPGETTETTTLAYDEHGQLESLTDPLERTWIFGFDAYGDLASEVDPLGNTRTAGYDGDSRLIWGVAPRGNAEGAEAAKYETTVQRDAQGRPTQLTDPLGHATEYAYDANGNLASETDAKGHTTKWTYNADDEEIEEERPNGAVLKTGYDGAGAVTSQTDAKERTTEYRRDVLEQAVEVIDPLGRVRSQEFDAAGNLVAVVDPAERKTTYGYDAADRLSEVDYSEEATPDASFEYDADGNPVAMSDGSGKSTFEYDQLGHLVRSENGHGDAVGFGYDLAGELTAITYPNGKAVSRAYDGAGRLKSVTDWLEGTTSFSYDADSDMTEITFPSASGNVDEYAYDRAGQMVGASFDAGAETLASLSYGRDAVAQVAEEARSGLPGPEELAYGYDKNDRLTAAGEASFAYDAADNLTEGLSSSNTYDAASQLEAGTGVTYVYDKLGERTKAAPEAGPATTYAYNQAQRLLGVERAAEGEAPAISASYGYDGTGLLTSRTSGVLTTHLTWDLSSDPPLLLSDEENSFVYGPGGLPIEQISAGEGEESTYLHHDQLGSTRLLTGAEGETTATFSYGPYGGLEAATGTASTPLGFAGQYTDSETGLQYLRARWYDPATGQFLTRDPLEALTRSPYGYAGENPLNATDPAGLEVVPIPAEGASACAAGPEAVIACAGIGVTACAAVSDCRDAASHIASEVFHSIFGGGDDSDLSPLEEHQLEIGQCRLGETGWYPNKEIGHGREELIKAAQFSAKYLSAVNGGPPGGPRGRALLALILILIHAARR